MSQAHGANTWQARENGYLQKEMGIESREKLQSVTKVAQEVATMYQSLLSSIC